MEKEILKLKELIDKANNIVFFGGAGVSTESGLLDFRSEKGLYNLKSKYGVPYEVILSHSYYEYKEDTFFKFYREFMIDTSVKPNYAHKFLAKLEKEKDVTIITQNIDGLHQVAGSKNVIELHGSIQRNYCEKCHAFYSLDDILNMDNVPHCPKCGGRIKPDVVLYEEALNERAIIGAIQAIQNADLLIIAGTSLKVYPAASFIDYFNGSNIVVINREKLDINRNIALEITDSIGKVFKEVDSIK